MFVEIFIPGDFKRLRNCRTPIVFFAIVHEDGEIGARVTAYRKAENASEPVEKPGALRFPLEVDHMQRGQSCSWKQTEQSW